MSEKNMSTFTLTPRLMKGQRIVAFIKNNWWKRNVLIKNFQSTCRLEDRPFSIPREDAKRLIGLTGARIKSIEKMTKTEIIIKDDPDEKTSKVDILSKDNKQISLAEGIIMHVLKHEKKSRSHEMVVPKKVMPLITGKSGRTVKKINDEANVELKFMNADKHNKIISILSSEKRDIEMAKKMIEEIILKSSFLTSPYVMKVPRKCIPLLVGVSGEIKERIEDEVGVAIEITDVEGVGEDQDVYIYYENKENADIAKNLIEFIINIDDPEQIQRFQSSFLRLSDKGHGLFSVIDVPSETVPFILGRKGRTLQHIETQSKTNIHIKKSKEKDKVPIVIQYEEEKGLQRAKKMIGDLVKSFTGKKS